MTLSLVRIVTCASAIGTAGLFGCSHESNAPDPATQSTYDSAVQTPEDSGVDLDGVSRLADSGANTLDPNSRANANDASASNPGRATTDSASPNSPASPDDGSSDAAVLMPFEGEGDPWKAPAPRARCGPDDQTDGKASGLSGDLRCNLEVIAQVEVPYFITMAWYRGCAYVNGPDGTTVFRVAPDGTPTVTAMLTEVGFRGNWESMKASSESGLLAGYEANAATLSLADLTKDCAHPEIASSIMLNGWVGTSAGHAGSFSPDGSIYYATSLFTADVFAVDLMDPRHPKVITSEFERSAHDLFIGKGGTRGYFTIPDVANNLVGVGSFAVMDLTQVQTRAPNARGTVISETT